MIIIPVFVIIIPVFVIIIGFFVIILRVFLIILRIFVIIIRVVCYFFSYFQELSQWEREMVNGYSKKNCNSNLVTMLSG